jgi:hypothetical protein
MVGRVGDREKWKDIVRHAKVHSGLQCQWKKKIHTKLRENPIRHLLTLLAHHILHVSRIRVKIHRCG